MPAQKKQLLLDLGGQPDQFSDGKSPITRRVDKANKVSPPHLVIRASAGTGKTHRLTNRYLELLHTGEAPDSILASTFTRKAAGEILQRVLLRLAGAARDEEQCEQLRIALGIQELSSEKCLLLLRSLTINLHRLQVCTLDAFFARIAGSFSLDLGLPPNWTIVEDHDDFRNRDEAIVDLLRDSGAESLTTLVHLLARGDIKRNVSDLVRDTVTNMHYLFEESRREAWNQLRRRKTLSDDSLLLAVADLHDAEVPAHKTFRKENAKLCRYALDADWKRFVKAGLVKKITDGEEVYCRKPIPENLRTAIERLVGHATAVLVNCTIDQTLATYDLLKMFDKHFQRIKYQRRAFRFDDVTRLVANRLSNHDPGKLSYRLDTRIQHLLLDEFQDTSVAQWGIVQPYAHHVTRANNVPSSLFCVGDAKQAIYGWRGGVGKILDSIPKQFAETIEESLTRSFRSAPPIIETVNHIFSRLHRHSNLGKYEKAVQTWVKQFENHATSRTYLSGYVTLETAPSDGNQSDSASKEALANITFDYAAQRVAEITRQAPGKTVSVLVRRNISVARMIHHLRRLGVEASEEGGSVLSDSAAVELILSLLHLADHPGDRIAQYHVSNSPFSPVVVPAFEEFTKARAVKIAASIRRQLQTDGYGKTLHAWSNILANSCNQRDARRLRQLVELAYQSQHLANLRADGFVQVVRSKKISDPVSSDVRVMTVHQSKGLQFDVVVLPDLNEKLVGQPPQVYSYRGADGIGSVERVCRYVADDLLAIFPSEVRRMAEQHRHLQVTESVCLLYVAVTRAIHALHMILPPKKSNRMEMPKTYAGLLEAALSHPQSSGSTIYSCGDPRWFESATVAKTVKTQPELVVSPLAFAPAQSKIYRGLEAVSPSGLEGGLRTKLSERFTWGSSGGKEYGSRVHMWFEQITWLDEQPSLEQLTGIARRLNPALVDERLQQDIARFTETLRDEAVNSVLNEQHYRSTISLAFPPEVKANLDLAPIDLEVRNEQAISVRDGKRLIGGTIDRLVLIKKKTKVVAADIVDYKTDQIDEVSSVQSKVKLYKPQLRAYAQSIAKMFGLPPENVICRLLFLASRSLEPVDWQNE